MISIPPAGRGSYFILGNEDLSNWDSFISEIEGMGIQDVLAVRQAAYNRYKAR